MNYAIRDWVAFWNSENSIYVNARHRDVHYAAIAESLAAYLPHAEALVLDYGCGEALHADRLAARCKRLILCEAASSVRRQLAQHFGHHSKIEVWAPDDISRLEPASVDFVAMISVAQYLSPEMLDDLLQQFRRLLRSDGALLLGDIIPPGVSAAADATALLRFAAANGFLRAAILGLVRTAFADYRKLRLRVGLTTYDEASLLAKLRAAGFSGERQPINVGHNRRRMTFLARPI